MFEWTTYLSSFNEVFAEELFLLLSLQLHVGPLRVLGEHEVELVEVDLGVVSVPADLVGPTDMPVDLGTVQTKIKKEQKQQGILMWLLWEIFSDPLNTRYSCKDKHGRQAMSEYIPPGLNRVKKTFSNAHIKWSNLIILDQSSNQNETMKFSNNL